MPAEYGKDKTIFGIDRGFIRECIERFPTESQPDILQEECAELIQAVSKLKRNKAGAMDQVKEEMAHVLISCAVLATICGITKEDIDKEVRKKADKYKMCL